MLLPPAQGVAAARSGGSVGLLGCWGGLSAAMPPQSSSRSVCWAVRRRRGPPRCQATPTKPKSSRCVRFAGGGPAVAAASRRRDIAERRIGGAVGAWEVVFVGAAGELASPDGVKGGALAAPTTTSAAAAYFLTRCRFWRVLGVPADAPRAAPGAAAPPGRSVGLLCCGEGFSATLPPYSWSPQASGAVRRRKRYPR